VPPASPNPDPILDQKNAKNCNKNVHWLKEHELSAVALQPSTDKNGIQNEYNIYRKGEIKRKIWIKAK